MVEWWQSVNSLWALLWCAKHGARVEWLPGKCTVTLPSSGISCSGQGQDAMAFVVAVSEVQKLSGLEDVC